MHRLLIVLSLFWALQVSAQNEVVWWLNGSTEKIVVTTPVPTESLVLHTGRLEYAPFQVAIATSEADRTFDAPTVDIDTNFFTLTWYEQVYFPILQLPTLAEIFTLARDTTSSAIPDGLRPLGESWVVKAGQLGALWVDVYVNAGTPAGDYLLSVSLMGNTQTLTIRVYDVDVPPTNAVSILVPTNKLDVIPNYSNGDDEGFLQAVNQLLVDNNLIPATFNGEPALNGNTWDFSFLDSQLDMLPEGAYFQPPMPFNEANDEYLVLDENGDPYLRTDFSNAHFVAQLDGYLKQLADYLRSKDRLEGALAYPIDETVWAADEPDHNGPSGYEHLADWKEVINRAGLRLTASRVSPATYAPDWLPSELVTDDTHVHLDLFDAGVEPYIEWMKQEGNTASIYLNHYGDLIELPATIHRAMAWRVYGRGIRNLTSYEAMDWFDEKWNYVLDPLNHPEQVAPKFTGYGVGALIYPGPLPSLRIKLLRESVEDARLLDLYGYMLGTEEAQSFAACMTPVALADFDPPSNIWDDAHAALLTALTTNAMIDRSICPSLPTFANVTIVADMEDNVLGGGEWTMDKVDFQTVLSPWDGSLAYQVTFTEPTSAASYWIGGRNWSQHDTVLMDIENPSPYYAEFDFAIGDTEGNYILLRPGATNLAPNSKITLELPLVVAFPSTEPFNFSSVAYLEMNIGMQFSRVDGYGDEYVYQMGPRTIVIDNIRVADKQ